MLVLDVRFINYVTNALKIELSIKKRVKHLEKQNNKKPINKNKTVKIKKN